MIVYDDDNIRVVFRNGNSDYLLITFNDMTFYANNNNFWGKSLADNNDISCLGFVSKGPNWFPEATMMKAAEAARSILESFERKIAFGFSMGGYGVLRYGCLLNASHSIAFSPQLTIDPRVTGSFDTRYGKFFNEIQNLSHEIVESNISPQCYVFFDPRHKQDNWHAGHSALRNAVKIKLRYCDHETIRIFSRSYASINLFQHVINGHLHEIRNLFQISRRNSPAYLSRLAWAALVGNHRRTAAAICKLADSSDGKFQPESAFLLSEVCKSLQNYDSAEKFASIGLEIGKTEFLLIKYCQILALNNKGYLSRFILSNLHEKWASHPDFILALKTIDVDNVE